MSIAVRFPALDQTHDGHRLHVVQAEEVLYIHLENSNLRLKECSYRGRRYGTLMARFTIRKAIGHDLDLFLGLGHGLNNL